MFVGCRLSDFTFSRLCTIQTRAWVLLWPHTAGSPCGPPESLSCGSSLLLEDLRNHSRLMDGVIIKVTFNPLNPFFNWLATRGIESNHEPAPTSSSSSFLRHQTASANFNQTCCISRADSLLRYILGSTLKGCFLYRNPYC